MKILLLVFVVCFYVFAEDQKQRVVFLDFAAQGVPKEMAASLSEDMRFALNETGVFEVMARSVMTTILQADNIQEPDQCNDLKCINQFGEVFNVKNILIGEIAQIGTSFSLSLQMCDVATGEIYVKISEKCQSCTFSEVVAASTKNAAKKLSMALGGRIQMSTEPAGATIFIDGIKKGITPIKLEGLAVGEQTVTFEKKGYFPVTKRAELSLGITTILNATLMPAANLMVSVAPKASQIRKMESLWASAKSIQ